MKILWDNENNLLNRRESEVLVESVKNPSFSEISKMLAEHFKIGEEVLAVRGIKGKFGSNAFLVSFSIYKSKEDIDRIEKKPKQKAQQGAPAK